MPVEAKDILNHLKSLFSRPFLVGFHRLVHARQLLEGQKSKGNAIDLFKSCGNMEPRTTRRGHRAHHAPPALEDGRLSNSWLVNDT